MSQSHIATILAELQPQDLWPAWQVVDSLEQLGKMDWDEARRWKEGIYGLMALWMLSPGDVVDLADPAEPARGIVQKILMLPLLERLP